MTRKVPQEQPPHTEDVGLKTWLFRLLTNINISLDQTNDLDPIGAMPDKIKNGMVRYFEDAIAGTDITHSGPWCYVDGVWKEMTQL